MEHIIAYENKLDVRENIIRPLSMYDQNVPTNSKKGLAICHGHNYSNRDLAELKFIEYWYLVDIDYAAFPDYIADATDKNTMAYFPNDYFDCVLTIFCPVIDENNKVQYTSMLKNIHRIIKKDGILASMELPLLFFRFVDENQFKNLVDEIKQIIPKEEIEKYKNDYITSVIEPSITESLIQFKEQLISNTNLDARMKKIRDELKTEKGFKKHKQAWLEKITMDKEIYMEIMSENYEGPNFEKVRQRLKELSIPITKKILENNGFKFKEIKGRFLFAAPVK